jgi:hypothetical protein
MRYATGSAFRMALEERLREQAAVAGKPLVRLRKTVAFDRLLARMVRYAPDAWILKGGLALQLLIVDGARTTKDVDVLLREVGQSARGLLVAAALMDLGDWFEFTVANAAALPAQSTVRLVVQSRLDGRQFESFHVDVGVGDPVVEPPDRRVVTDLLAFADIPETVVSCYPVTQHVAEKVHALSRPRARGENSRVKDLVDLAIFAERSSPSSSAMRAAIDAAFDAAGTHAVPDRLPDVPASWAAEYRRMAREVALAAEVLAGGVELTRRFVDPVLDGSARGSWRPERRAWG